MVVSLRTLGLNCWLAAVVPSVLAATVIAVLQWSAVQAARDGSLIGYQEAIQGATAGMVIADPTTIDPERIHTLLPRWRNISIVRVLDDEQVAVIASWGEAPLRDEAVVDQVLAEAPFGSGGGILADGHVVVASALRNEALLPVAILYAESDSPLAPAFAAARDLPAPTLLIIVGLVLAWYLTTRIAQPVQALEARAHAALRGQAVHNGPASAETEGLSSAVDLLAAAYSSSSEQTAAKAPTDSP